MSTQQQLLEHVKGLMISTIKEESSGSDVSRPSSQSSDESTSTPTTVVEKPTPPSHPTTPTQNDDSKTLKSLQHIAQLPLVQEAQDCYIKIKNWNCLCKLYLNTAEWTLQQVLVGTASIQRCLQNPINKMDDVALKSLEYVEGKFPAVTLTSQQVLDNTKSCVDKKLRPCKKSLADMKKCYVNKVKKVIGVSLSCLPRSLLPDNVQIVDTSSDFTLPKDVYYVDDIIAHVLEQAPEVFRAGSDTDEIACTPSAGGAKGGTIASSSDNNRPISATTSSDESSFSTTPKLPKTGTSATTFPKTSGAVTTGVGTITTSKSGVHTAVRTVSIR